MELMDSALTHVMTKVWVMDLGLMVPSNVCPNLIVYIGHLVCLTYPI